jgi:hypothetical protein
MQGFFNKPVPALFVFAFLIASAADPRPCFAGDQRTIPLEMYLIVDGSPALQGGRETALGWLCDYVVDGILREGDRVTLWIAGDTAARVLQETLSSPEKKEALKNQIRTLSGPQGRRADYTGALREAAKLETAIGADRMSYTLIISGVSAGYVSFPGSDEAAALLRFSRVQDFSGWRAVTASLNAGSQVKQAAADFLKP